MPGVSRVAYNRAVKPGFDCSCLQFDVTGPTTGCRRTASRPRLPRTCSSPSWTIRRTRTTRDRPPRPAARPDQQPRQAALTEGHGTGHSELGVLRGRRPTGHDQVLGQPDPVQQGQAGSVSQRRTDLLTVRRRAGVLGKPIRHSLSPVITTPGTWRPGLTGWQYTAHVCAESDLAGFVAGLDDDWAGLSLTMPLKEVALDVADEVAPSRRLSARPTRWYANRPHQFATVRPTSRTRPVACRRPCGRSRWTLPRVRTW